jgi:hypothetical protein
MGWDWDGRREVGMLDGDSVVKVTNIMTNVNGNNSAYGNFWNRN